MLCTIFTSLLWPLSCFANSLMLLPRKKFARSFEPNRKAATVLPITVSSVRSWEYHLNGRTIGELDLVLLRKQKATEVIEVKCRKDYGDSADKADEQLDRFSQYIPTLRASTMI